MKTKLTLTLKTKTILYSFVGVGIFLSACGGNKDNPQARALLDEAQKSMEFGDFGLSLELIDSLQKNYASEIAIGKEALALRPKVIELFTQKQIITTDSLIATNESVAQRLKPQMQWVKTPGMIEGYYVAKSAYNPSFLNTTGVQGRVSEIGQFYVVSSLNPGGIKHTSVALASGSLRAETPAVNYDGDSNFRIGAGEMITFSPEQSDSLGHFAATHRGKLNLVFASGKKNKTISLSSKQVEAIATAWEYSKALCDVRQLAVERQRLDRVLQTARDQQARVGNTENRE